MSLPVAILAGGLATRLRPFTEHLPKALMDVAGKPFAVRQLELLRRRGIEHVVFCLGYRGSMVQEALGDGSRWGIDVRYSYDGDRLLGTGGALRNALPLLGGRFLVLYGDSYLECDYAAVECAFLASGRLGLMTVHRNEDRWDTSNVLYRDGAIIRYDKRERDPAMRHIDYGLGALDARAFDPYPQGTVVDLAEVYQDLLGRGELAGFEVQERFYEIGSPDGLAETIRYFTDKE